MNYFYAIAALIAAHYIADFALQNDYVAQAKAKVHTAPDGIHALTAHAVHHFACAALALLLVGVTPPIVLMGALVVGVSHWLIDYGKAVAKRYEYHADQIMHLVVAVSVAVLATLDGSL